MILPYLKEKGTDLAKHAAMGEGSGDFAETARGFVGQRGDSPVRGPCMVGKAGAPGPSQQLHILDRTKAKRRAKVSSRATFAPRL